MSAFLGKIHFLLYNKIQVQEKLQEETLKFAEENSIPVEELKLKINEKYGYPETTPLEQVINQDNIHGWLQSKIKSVENRTATAVTELVKTHKVNIEDIGKVYFQNGKKIMEDMVSEDLSPKDLYTIIFDNLLEGMPCDMVNEEIDESEDEFSWKTTRNIHLENWKNANGEITNFYTLRDAWINGFLSTIGREYSYTRTEDGYNKIRKE